MKLLFIILAAVGISSSCTSAQPVKKNFSATAATGNYVFIVRVLNADNIAGKVHEVFQQEHREQCQYQLEITNGWGLWGRVKEVKVWLRFVSEKIIDRISSKLYEISNVIEVIVNKN